MEETDIQFTKKFNKNHSDYHIVDVRYDDTDHPIILLKVLDKNWVKHPRYVLSDLYDQYGDHLKIYGESFVDATGNKDPNGEYVVASSSMQVLVHGVLNGKN